MHAESCLQRRKIPRIGVSVSLETGVKQMALDHDDAARWQRNEEGKTVCGIIVGKNSFC